MFNLKKISILIEMGRPHGLITPLCGCFSGLYLAGLGFPSLSSLSGVYSMIILGWFGGVILNDYFDRDVDSITDSYRPLPSGRITVKEALYSAIAFLSAALVISLSLSIILMLATAVYVLLMLLYNSLLKKKGLMGSLCFGLIEGISFIVGVYAIGDFNLLAFFILISIIMLHTSVNLIGAIKDIDGDRKIGNLTIPAKYGVNTTVKLILLFVLFSLIAGSMPAFLKLLNFRYLPLLLVMGFWFLVIVLNVKKDSKLGYMGFGMFYMGASVYYINFITGI